MPSNSVRETYTHGYGRAARQHMVARTVETNASFVLPHLRPGLDVLDCGCGPGSITVDLAERVAPGRVVGIDLANRQVAAARALAAERGIINVRFELGNLYALPFPDASFDLAFAHTVLEHLGDPLRALREMRRVLRPGGLVAIRDTDRATCVVEPALPRFQRGFALTGRAMEHNGGSPYYARRQRTLLLEAGFERTEGFAFVECYGDPDGTRYWGNALADHLASPALADLIIGQGWLDRKEIDATIAAQREWGERSDAYFAVMFCAALGWVPRD
jgi:ubiquinone/menaquinone biosynthesis C-methylase UbiE